MYQIKWRCTFQTDCNDRRLGFAGTALTGISLLATVTSLGDNVFHNCSELIGVQSYPATAPTITATTFSHDKGTIKEQCRLFVLPTASSAYDSWKNLL